MYRRRWIVLKYPAAVGKTTVREWYKLNENAMSSLTLGDRAANSAGYLELWLHLLNGGRKNAVGRRCCTS